MNVYGIPPTKVAPSLDGICVAPPYYSEGAPDVNDKNSHAQMTAPPPYEDFLELKKYWRSKLDFYMSYLNTENLKFWLTCNELFVFQWYTQFILITDIM